MWAIPTGTSSVKKKNQVRSPSPESRVPETGSDPPIGSGRESGRDSKSGHIKKFCCVKLHDEDTNTAYEVEESDDIKWEQGFSIEVIDQSAEMASTMHPIGVTGVIDYEKEWIVDSRCSHHATGDANLLSDVRPHEGKRVIMTADNSLHPVMKEGNFNSSNDTKCVSLKDGYHVPGLKKNLASFSQITDSGMCCLVK